MLSTELTGLSVLNVFHLPLQIHLLGSALLLTLRGRMLRPQQTGFGFRKQEEGRREGPVILCSSLERHSPHKVICQTTLSRVPSQSLCLFPSITHPCSLMLSAQRYCVILVVPYMGITTLNSLFISYSSNYLFLLCQSFYLTSTTLPTAPSPHTRDSQRNPTVMLERL